MTLTVSLSPPLNCWPLGCLCFFILQSNQTDLVPVVSPDRNRWRTLLSVDDLVEGVVGALQEANVLDHTYVLYSSDHVSAATVGLGCDCCRR